MDVNFGLLTLGEERRRRGFEKRAFRATFVTKTEEVIGGWRKLHNLSSSPIIIPMVKSRRLRRVRHVARMERREMYFDRNTRAESKKTTLDLGGRLKWVLETLDGVI
jgi:hypothetical protein